jgi:choline kinase
MAHQANRHIAPARLPSDNGRLNVIIPAAGIGKRMKSKGPKGLLILHHGMSVLEKQIRTILKVYPHAEIVVVGGFEYTKIRNELWGNFPVRIVCNSDYETTNVTHSVGIGLDACLPGPLMIVHGDLVFNQQTIKGLAGKQSSLLVADKHLEPGEVGIGHQDGIVTNLSYALETKWGQIAYLQGKELLLFQEVIRNNRVSNMWFLYESLNYVMSKGGEFLAHQPSGMKITEIDKYNDLKKAKQI